MFSIRFVKHMKKEFLFSKKLFEIRFVGENAGTTNADLSSLSFHAFRKGFGPKRQSVQDAAHVNNEIIYPV